MNRSSESFPVVVGAQVGAIFLTVEVAHLELVVRLRFDTFEAESRSIERCSSWPGMLIGWKGRVPVYVLAFKGGEVTQLLLDMEEGRHLHFVSLLLAANDDIPLTPLR